MKYVSRRSIAMMTALQLSFVTPALADNLAGGFVIGNTSYLASTFLPLHGTATRINFNVPQTGLVSITYNAKCNVEGTADSYSDLDVFVDNTAVAPTNGAFDVFCSQYGGLGRATLTVVVRLQAGNHFVRIRASTYQNATSAFIGDSTIVVTR
jgi:hypothetical protein